MSYLYEIECHCLIGGSADVESVGGVDAFLNAEPAALHASVEAPAKIISPERAINVSLNYTVVENSGPNYEINIYHDEIQVGSVIVIDDISYEVIEIDSNTKTIFSLSGPPFLEDGVAKFTYTQEETFPEPTVERTHNVLLESHSDINDHISADLGLFLQIVGAVSDIPDGLTVDYSISHEVELPVYLDTEILDKFVGDFPDYFKLINFSRDQESRITEKLYPSGDVLPDDFISSDNTIDDLHSFIEEGIFVGDYTTNRAYSQRITDDLNSYITPNTNHTEGVFTYKAFVDAPTVKPSDTRLLIRLSAPLNNLESRVPPRYTIKDAKFRDPNGVIISEYEDIVFFGDASDDREDNAFKNFTTFSLSPKRNVVAEMFEWQDGYPNLRMGNGYTVELTVVAEALDDAFDEGFTHGFADIVASGDLFPDLLPTNSVRISAIEIWNSGFPGIGPSPENYLTCVIMPPEKGKRLERKIKPTLMPYYGFDTAIFPESGNLLWTDHNGRYSNIDQCDNKKLISYITDGKSSTYITTHDVIDDSGKLILKFGAGSSQVSEVTQGAFNVAFDQSLAEIWTSPTFSDGRYHPSGAFNTENTRPLDQIDDIFFGIDSISLSVTAKKAPNARDFFLDVVGYSNDCILRVTNPVGGFLQNASGIDYYLPPTASGFATVDDLGVDGEAISDKFSYYENISSGDHYELSDYPLVDSEEFRTYELPLKIFEDKVTLGKSRDYNWSTFFENLYLDIFPLPSGACISDIHIIARYKPQNAFTLATLGGDIGRIKPGRSEGAFYPQAMGSNDDYLNMGSGFQPLSRIEGIPHQYTSANTLKTNYGRRWRGVHSLTYGPFNVNEFGFAFENPTFDTPFIDCLVDFSRRNGNSFYSRGNPLSSSLETIFNSNNSLEIFQNVGLRLTTGSMFENILPGYTSDYKTADWTALSNGATNFENHELYGQIFDGYDNAVRFGSSDNIQFSNINPSSGIVLYARFIPDASATEGPNNYFNDSTIITLSQGPSFRSLGVGYHNGFLSVSGFDGSSYEFIQDTIPYTDYQYPLSVIVTYNEKYDNKLRLYTDNELHKGEFQNLRATSNEVDLPLQPGDNQLYELIFGESEIGISEGLPMLLCEIGYTEPFSGSGSHIVESNPDRNLKEISASEFFDGQRVKFFDPEESYENDTFKLWNYINEDSYHDWAIGAFLSPQFSQAFDLLSKRTNRDLISFHLEHDGIAYEERVDLTFPQNIDSGVSYHSQVENDFIRFHVSDAVDTFYAIHPRVTKNLPHGYSFKDKALVVDTILTNETSGNIDWDRCTSGPKLIVSLYTKNQVPYWEPENYGLVNRSIHYIEHCPSSIIKIESSFNYNDVCDETERWAFFPDEQKVKDFKERLFSDDINDMFLQYDIVYPSSDGFLSNLKIHTAHIRAEDALIIPKESNDDLNLNISGVLGVETKNIDLFVYGISGYLNSAANPDFMSLCISGETMTPYNNDLNMSVFGAYRESQLLPMFTESRGEESGVFKLCTEGSIPVEIDERLTMSTYGSAVISSGPTSQGGGAGGGGTGGGGTGGGGTGGGGTGGGGQNRPGMSMSIYNEESTLGSFNGRFNLSVLKPLSQDIVLQATKYGDGVFTSNFESWNYYRGPKFGMVVFNDHLNAGGYSADSPFNSLNIMTRGEQKLESNFRTIYHSLYTAGSDRLFKNLDMPLYLHNPLVSEVATFDSISLVAYNVHGNVPNVGGVGFNWDAYDYGIPIDARDNMYSKLSLDNEIRGVNTVGYGVCDNE